MFQGVLGLFLYTAEFIPPVIKLEQINEKA